MTINLKFLDTIQMPTDKENKKKRKIVRLDIQTIIASMLKYVNPIYSNAITEYMVTIGVKQSTYRKALQDLVDNEKVVKLPSLTDTRCSMIYCFDMDALNDYITRRLK